MNALVTLYVIVLCQFSVCFEDLQNYRKELKGAVLIKNATSKTSESKIEMKRSLIDVNEIEDKSNDIPSEYMQTAASNNYVYRPLFVYRKIEHSKRRITMYNAFAG